MQTGFNVKNGKKNTLLSKPYIELQVAPMLIILHRIKISMFALF